jgi:hypothetical protein
MIAGIFQKDKLSRCRREPENAPERNPVTLVTSLLEPPVTDLELERSIDAWVLVTDRGVGYVQGAEIEGYGPIWSGEDVEANTRTGLEVDSSCVSRRKLVGRKKDATDSFEKRNDFALSRTDEVPFPNDRGNPSGVRGFAIVQNLDGRCLNVPLEGSPEHPRTARGRKHATYTATDGEAAKRGVVAHPIAITGENSVTPARMGQHRRVLREETDGTQHRYEHTCGGEVLHCYSVANQESEETNRSGPFSEEFSLEREGATISGGPLGQV